MKYGFQAYKRMVPREIDSSSFRRLLAEQGLPLLGYLLLTFLFTWPLIRHFTTRITGVGDARHLLWLLWYSRESLFSAGLLFRTDLLYYPHGTSLHINALGPFLGILTIPFWPLGPEAVYNTALVLGFALSGHAMYLLAREVGFGRALSFFAGTVFLAAPIHVGAISGHLSKVFVASLPLAFLFLHRTLEPRRSPWWAVGVTGALMVALLHSAEQFVFGGLGLALYVTLLLIWPGRRNRRRILLRSTGAGGLALLLNSPLLYLIWRASTNPLITVASNAESWQHHPDLLQFFIPPPQWTRFMAPVLQAWSNRFVTVPLETSIFLMWTAQLLILVAIIRNRRLAMRRWLLLGIGGLLISLGPSLKIYGETLFTEYNLPIILPYAFLTALPGLDFWRTPGRFMVVSMIGFSLCAAYGLQWLAQQSEGAGRRLLLVAIATTLVLIETWPKPWPQETLRTVPPFYQQIAADPEEYGVFDLPIRPDLERNYWNWYVYYSSYYQMYQMTHRKGIASGYIDRPFNTHPLFGYLIDERITESPLQSRLLVDGQPSSRFSNLEWELDRLGYRYVVYHKSQPGVLAYGYESGSWADQQSQQLMEALFPGEPPLVDDQWTTVYEVDAVDSPEQLIPSIALYGGDNRSSSPATLFVVAPRATAGQINLTLESIEDPVSGTGYERASATLTSSGGFQATVDLVTGQPARIPVLLEAGSQNITLEITPDASSQAAARKAPVDFVIAWLDMRYAENQAPSSAIVVNGQLPAMTAMDVLPFFADGWYDPDTPTWRWAASPAMLRIYSSEPRAVTIGMTPLFLNNPADPGQTSENGTMRIALNGGAARSLPLSLNQPFEAELTLEQGWNVVTFSLDSGSFRPIDVEEGNNDARPLSFAVHGVTIEAR